MKDMLSRGQCVHQTKEVSEGEDAPAGRSHFRRKPPKPGYKVSGVPKRYIDQVQLSAVLRPAYGRLRTDADIIRCYGLGAAPLAA
jgi:hypothetical protein